MNDLHGFYFGTITEVYPPSHPRNGNHRQYEYEVLITADDYAQIPVKCIRMDPYGSFHNYEDAILAQGYIVFVQCPRGDKSLGVIVGGSRHVGDPQVDADGYYYRHRFNEVELAIDNTGTLTWKADSGPVLTLSKKIIKLDDFAGSTIILDSVSGSIVETGSRQWKALQAGAAINLQGGLIGIGANGVELLERIGAALGQIVELLVAIGSETHIDGFGLPTTPPVNSAAFSKVKAEVQKIMDDIKKITGTI